MLCKVLHLIKIQQQSSVEIDELATISMIQIDAIQS